MVTLMYKMNIMFFSMRFGSRDGEHNRISEAFNEATDHGNVRVISPQTSTQPASAPPVGY